MLEDSLGRDLPGHVVQARNAGRSWRTIAADLRARTGLKVNHETVRNWFSDELVTVTVVAVRSHDQAP